MTSISVVVEESQQQLWQSKRKKGDDISSLGHSAAGLKNNERQVFKLVQVPALPSPPREFNLPCHLMDEEMPLLGEMEPDRQTLVKL